MLSDLCDNPNKPIKIDFYISSKTGQHSLFGSSQFTVNKIKFDDKIWLAVGGQEEAKAMFKTVRFQ